MITLTATAINHLKNMISSREKSTLGIKIELARKGVPVCHILWNLLIKPIVAMNY